MMNEEETFCSWKVLAEGVNKKTLMNLGSFCNKGRSGYANSAMKAFKQRITTENL